MTDPTAAIRRAGSVASKQWPVAWRAVMSGWGSAAVYGLLAVACLAPPLRTEANLWPGSWTGETLRAIWLVATAGRYGARPDAVVTEVFYPVGAVMSELADGDWLPCFLAGLFTQVLGLRPTYVLAMAGILLANGMAVRQLAAVATPSKGIAAAVGALAVLSPGLLELVEKGDLAAGFVAVPAFSVVAAVQLRRRGGTWRGLDVGSWAGIVHAMCWQHAILVLPALAVAVLWPTPRAPATARLGEIGAALGTGLLLVFLGASLGLGFGAPNWLPGPPVLTGAGPGIILRYLQGPGSGYIIQSLLGADGIWLLPWALLLPALAGRQATRWWWSFLAVILVASAGPGVRIGGSIVPMPIAWAMDDIPALAAVAAPGRWAALSVIPSAILAAKGLERISARSTRPPLRRMASLPAAAVLAVAVAFVAGSFPVATFELQTSPLPTSEEVEWKGSVVLPGTSANASLAWQIGHPDVPVFFGPPRNWFNVAPPDWGKLVADNSFVESVTAADEHVPPYAEDDLRTLTAAGITQIVVDRASLHGDSAARVAQSLRTDLANSLGYPSLASNSLLVYNLGGGRGESQ